MLEVARTFDGKEQGGETDANIGISALQKLGGRNIDVTDNEG